MQLVVRRACRCSRGPAAARCCGCRRRRPRPARSAGSRRRRPAAPVAGSRVKATPVPESMPRLPKTIEHDVDRGAEVGRDALLAAVEDRARSAFHESKTARTARSICSRGSCGKSRPACSRDDLLERVDQRPAGRRRRGRGRRVTPLACLASSRASSKCSPSTSQHGLAEHLDQPAVGVPGEPLVAGLLGQALHRLVVEADVEDGLHHAGHRELRAGAHRDQQRVVGVAELLAHRASRARARCSLDLGAQLRRARRRCAR